MIEVKVIEEVADLKKAFAIREEVYIKEQGIDRADEFDQYEEGSVHFLATDNIVTIGTARYRTTDEGVKLERFAVLPNWRKRGVASKVMEKMLEHINADNKLIGQKLYLNAQLTALPLYEKFNFKPEGERFMECGIPHQKMVLKHQ